MIKNLGMLLGRWSIALIFLVAAAQKLFSWDATAALMTAKGMEMVPAFLAGAIAFEILCSLGLIMGAQTRLAAALLALFLIPVTILFHDFWATPVGDMRTIQTTMFFKNWAIFGGLLYIMAWGPGRFSRDYKRTQIREETVEEEEE